MGSGHAIRHSIIYELQAGQVGKLLYGAIRQCMVGATCLDAGGLSCAESQAKVVWKKPSPTGILQSTRVTWMHS